MDNVNPRPLKTEPSKYQQIFIDGPVGPEIKYFICKSCKNKFFDLTDYFYNTPSIKCISCMRKTK